MIIVMIVAGVSACGDIHASEKREEVDGGEVRGWESEKCE